MICAARRSAFIAAVAIAFASVTASATAEAAAGRLPKTVQVQGSQTRVGDGLYAMHSAPGRAGLVGEWETEVFSWKFVLPFYFETGTERFDGCLDLNGDNACHHEPTGSLTFNYAAWVKFDPDLLPTVYKQLAGGCVHPVTGGSGGFAGARGLLTMRDRLVGDTIETTYRGTLRFGPGGSVSAAEVPAVPEFGATAMAEVSPTSEAAGPPAPAAQPHVC